MKWICLIVLLTANLLYAQKIVKKSIVNPEITALTFDVTNSFALSVDTVPGNEVLIEAIMEGEYGSEILINVRESGNTLLVNTEFQPHFKKPSDKLSAHKVISIALRVQLPERKRVTIFGTGCNVSAKGEYDTLKISLNDGRCHLENVVGAAKVATQSGTISVLAANAEIEAASRYGRVMRNQIPSGDSFYDVSSVSGDILFYKTE